MCIYRCPPHAYHEGIHYWSLRDIFLQGLIVRKIHHVVASRTYTALSDISPKECPKQTSTNLRPQIAYVVNINQTNLILTKMWNQVHRDFHSPYMQINKPCSIRPCTWSTLYQELHSRRKILSVHLEGWPNEAYNVIYSSQGGQMHRQLIAVTMINI